MCQAAVICIVSQFRPQRDLLARYQLHRKHFMTFLVDGTTLVVHTSDNHGPLSSSLCFFFLSTFTLAASFGGRSLWNDRLLMDLSVHPRRIWSFRRVAPLRSSATLRFRCSPSGSWYVPSFFRSLRPQRDRADELLYMEHRLLMLSTSFFSQDFNTWVGGIKALASNGD